ncbi:MAG: lipoyl synthase [Phycisphaerales bacterium]
MVHLSLTDRVLDNQLAADDFVKRGKPRWLRARLPHTEKYGQLLRLVRSQKLHTVCEEASCPNMGECWSNGVATLMILGDVCTRSCGFCHIATGRPPVLDTDEPARVAQAVAAMNLKYVVLTSVDRDELSDGGASIWADTIKLTRQASPNTQIEVLIPDFQGDWAALQLVLDARPDVLAHNLETVRRLYPAVRPQAKYHRSIELLHRAKQQGLVTKTGIMVGIGERDDEIAPLMRDVLFGGEGAGKSFGFRVSGFEEKAPASLETRNPTASTAAPPLKPETQPPSPQPLIPNPSSSPSPLTDILTIGQYLQPSPHHLPVQRFVTPEIFADYKRQGEAMGFAHVESGPMVRSSYHADLQAQAAHAATS